MLIFQLLLLQSMHTANEAMRWANRHESKMGNLRERTRGVCSARAVWGESAREKETLSLYNKACAQLGKICAGERAAAAAR